VHPSRRFSSRLPAVGLGRRFLSLLVIAAAVVAAGCHSHTQDSGYGITWFTLSDVPGDFTSYQVTIDSVTLVRSDGAVITAIAAAELVDLAKLTDVSELWSSAAVPNGTYVGASIVVDYTAAKISVLVNGAPQTATVVDPTGAAVTTVTVTVKFDPANPMIITPSESSSHAVRLAVDFNLAASGTINLATTPATVTVKPYMTAAIAPADGKPVRVRGPLLNSSVAQGTYSVYVRPFNEEVNTLGTVTMFNDANTVYTLDGLTYTGSAGLTALSQAAAGSTVTSATTTFQPTATAGKFNTSVVIAGSSQESGTTAKLSGDVIARVGDVLTVRGGTLSTTDGATTYEIADSFVTLAAGTVVTIDGQAGVSGLNKNSIGVGQHIVALGPYTTSATTSAILLDASAGKVRLQPTQIWGQLISGAPGSLSLALQTIDNWPASIYTFAGNGVTAGQDSSAANYRVNTGTADASGFAAGSSLWISGLTSPFGTAPPDFKSQAIAQESAVPASLRVTWVNGGTAAPFLGFGNSGFSVDLNNANYGTGAIRVGPESIDLKSLAASPQIVPTGTAVSATFSPLFSVGNTASAISSFSSFASFVTLLNTTLAVPTPVMQLEVGGLYNRATNTFTANTVNVVL
jgi:hypothetical protein